MSDWGHARPPRPTAVLWGLAFFACFQVILHVALDRWLPDVRDPEFGRKLARLRERLAREPGRPLLLALGSSRVNMGFRPDVLPDYTSAGGGRPLLFNFGINCSGPLLTHLWLQRLLAEGIRPRWVIVEIMPTALNQEGPWGEEDGLVASRLGWQDVPRLWPYCQRHGRLCRQWGPLQLAPCFSHRLGLLCRYAPDWLAWDAVAPAWKTEVSASGWTEAREVPGKAGERTRWMLEMLAPVLESFRISAVVDRSLRDLLARCRREGIAVLLLRTPETGAQRALYPPAARAAIDAHLGQLSRECGVAVVDAGAWVPDGEEYFCDAHHLRPAGAALFTERLGRDVLRPFLAGEPLPGVPTPCGVVR